MVPDRIPELFIDDPINIVLVGAAVVCCEFVALPDATDACFSRIGMTATLAELF